jgi:hypothetical protein
MASSATGERQADLRWRPYLEGRGRVAVEETPQGVGPHLARDIFDGDGANAIARARRAIVEQLVAGDGRGRARRLGDQIQRAEEGGDDQQPRQRPKRR